MGLPAGEHMLRPPRFRDDADDDDDDNVVVVVVVVVVVAAAAADINVTVLLTYLITYHGIIVYRPAHCRWCSNSVIASHRVSTLGRGSSDC